MPNELRAALERRNAKKSINELSLQRALAELRADNRREIDRLKRRLETIKSLVVGEKGERWNTDWNTTKTRGVIADLCEPSR